jgi:hypothetical protein
MRGNYHEPSRPSPAGRRAVLEHAVQRRADPKAEVLVAEPHDDHRRDDADHRPHRDEADG